MSIRRSPQIDFVLALGCATVVSIGLFAYGAWHTHSLVHAYLLWNLFLAWLPLVFALWLRRVLRHKLWSSWEGLAASVIWLLFLPNSFYMISDFIHLQDASVDNVLYDAVLFTSFINTAVILGFSSLYIVHRQLQRRLGDRLAAGTIAATLFISSFAIYIGRDLRWNSWDVLTNPGGLLFDVSDRLQHPAAYPTMLLTVAAFFVLLTSMYAIAWRAIAYARG